MVTVGSPELRSILTPVRNAIEEWTSRMPWIVRNASELKFKRFPFMHKGAALRSLDLYTASDRLNSDMLKVYYDWIGEFFGCDEIQLKAIAQVTRGKMEVTSPDGKIIVCQRAALMSEPLTWPVLNFQNLFALVYAYHHSMKMPLTACIAKAIKSMISCGDDALMMLTKKESQDVDFVLLMFGGKINREKDFTSEYRGVFCEQIFEVLEYRRGIMLKRLKLPRLNPLFSDPGDPGDTTVSIVKTSDRKWHGRIIRLSKKVFGTYRAALRKAGLEPDLPHELGGGGFPTDWGKFRNATRLTQSYARYLLSQEVSDAERHAQAWSTGCALWSQRTGRYPPKFIGDAVEEFFDQHEFSYARQASVRAYKSFALQATNEFGMPTPSVHRSVILKDSFGNWLGKQATMEVLKGRTPEGRATKQKALNYVAKAMRKCVYKVPSIARDYQNPNWSLRNPNAVISRLKANFGRTVWVREKGEEIKEDDKKDDHPDPPNRTSAKRKENRLYRRISGSDRRLALLSCFITHGTSPPIQPGTTAKAVSQAATDDCWPGEEEIFAERSKECPEQTLTTDQPSSVDYRTMDTDDGKVTIFDTRGAQSTGEVPRRPPSESILKVPALPVPHRRKRRTRGYTERHTLRFQNKINKEKK
jgi:hypothetical protein